MKYPLLFSLLIITISVSACSIHKIDTQQGNVITQELLQEISLGMNKTQVRRVLGTPMIHDPFHAERWDYTYRFYDGEKDQVTSGHLTLQFENNALSSINVLHPLPKESDIQTPRLIRK